VAHFAHLIRMFCIPAVMAVLIVLGSMATRHLSAIPTKMQNVFE
jgi:F0F1-type ATP synthase membrane subunit a